MTTLARPFDDTDAADLGSVAGTLFAGTLGATGVRGVAGPTGSGPNAGATGVTAAEASDVVLVPISLVARTVNVYAAPLTSPPMTIGLPCSYSRRSPPGQLVTV